MPTTPGDASTASRRAGARAEGRPHGVAPPERGTTRTGRGGEYSPCVDSRVGRSLAHSWAVVPPGVMSRPPRSVRAPRCAFPYVQRVGSVARPEPRGGGRGPGHAEDREHVVRHGRRRGGGGRGAARALGTPRGMGTPRYGSLGAGVFTLSGVHVYTM